jgi:hypothetical protein
MAEILPTCLPILNQNCVEREHVCFSVPEALTKQYYVSVHALVGGIKMYA